MPWYERISIKYIVQAFSLLKEIIKLEKKFNALLKMEFFNIEHFSVVRLSYMGTNKQYRNFEKNHNLIEH